MGLSGHQQKFHKLEGPSHQNPDTYETYYHTLSSHGEIPIKEIKKLIILQVNRDRA